jgi:hypothetical protein
MDGTSELRPERHHSLARLIPEWGRFAVDDEHLDGHGDPRKCQIWFARRPAYSIDRGAK